MSKHVRKILPLLLCLLLMACLLPAAYADEVEVSTLAELQNVITAFNQLREQDPTARINTYTSGNFAITENITIPEGFQLRCGNDLTIAADAVVTVDGKLDAIEGGHVSILGTVINNNQFRMFDTGVMELSGTLVNNHDVYYERVSTDRTHLVINSGATFTNNSNFAIADDLVRDPAVLGVNVDGYCVARMWDEPDMSRYFAPEVFDHFEGMCSSGKFVYLELHGIEEVSIAESMNIPENMSVKMGSTRLVASNGKTLHVRGELSIKDLVVENGGGLLLHGNGTVAVAGELNNSSAVVVMDNSVLNVSGEMVNRDALRVEGNSSVTVSGKLTNNATIGIGENAQIAVSGEFVNNRLINLRNWNGTRPLITIGAQGKYEEHGGFDVLTQFDYESAISAIDLSDYCRLVYVTSDNNRVTRLFPGRDLSFDPNGFKQMCQNGDTVYLEIRGRETFQMDSDVTIPNVMEVVANDVGLVIPAGVNVKLKGHMILRNGAALDLKGKLSEGTLGLDEGTAVNLTGQLDVDELRLDGQITVGSGATLDEAKLIELANGRPNGGVTVADASAKAYIRSDGLSEALMSAWITLQGDETTARVYYHAKSDTDFTNMTAGIGNLPASLAGALTIEYPATIRGNVDFPGAELRVAGQKGGSLTVAKGAVLRASNVNIKSANVTISGTFIAAPSYRHSGSLTLNADNGVNSTLTVTETGILGGYQCTVEVPNGIETASCVFGFNPGQMKDASHPYRPNYQIYLIVAEMSLPSGLTTIESEAFAGGSFNSVYIPNSVTSIAFDAFGDRTDLKVYGEYDTAAETFAHDHGFPFAPPNLAKRPA